MTRSVENNGYHLMRLEALWISGVEYKNELFRINTCYSTAHTTRGVTIPRPALNRRSNTGEKEQKRQAQEKIERTAPFSRQIFSFVRFLVIQYSTNKPSFVISKH